MSLNLNKTILAGRLVSAPEVKQTPSGNTVCNIRIAVNRRVSGGDHPESDFFNVTAWRGTADFVARYFHKGSSICIVGSLQNSSWQDQKGEKHYRTDILADEVMFVDSKSESQPAQSSYGQQTVPKFEEIGNDQDLPF